MNHSYHLILLLQIIHSNSYDVSNILSSSSRGEVTTSGEWCQSWKNLVCGSDGVTYWNECLFEKSQDKTPDLSHVSSGACNSVECEGCDHEFTNLQYCTSNNRLVPDQCTFDCLVDEYPLIIEDFNGCGSHHPTVNEMESASTATFNKIVEEFLSRTLAQPTAVNATTPERKDLSMELGAIALPGFQGQFSSNGTIFKVAAKRGWMKEITWVSMPETFSISSEKINRLMFKLKTGSLELGYNQFSVSEASGRREKTTKIAVTVDNATLALIVDVEADKYNCTKLLPVEVRLTEVPTVKLALALPVGRAVPRSELDGFMKENTLRKINQAIENTLYKRMLRVGCLSWTSKTSKEKCFGAFQRRYCST